MILIYNLKRIKVQKISKEGAIQKFKQYSFDSDNAIALDFQLKPRVLFF
jgi:hypothetical protein